jgi:hypothetical protein
MATYHCSVKVGSKGRAGVHAQYIAREGDYAAKEKEGRGKGGNGERPNHESETSSHGHAAYISREGKSSGKEDVEYTESGNMPKWAERNPNAFWAASDTFERANGSTYREIEVALPRELNKEERVELVRGFVKEHLGDKHPYSLAVHNPKAAIEKGEQPHAHIMFSERMRDGYQRDAKQFFSRYNGKSPEKGGCKKDSWGGDKQRLIALRESWAKHTNRALEKKNVEARVDHRSLKAQGIDRPPEKHLGPYTARRDEKVKELTQYRTATKEKVAAERDVSRIDIKTTLAQALRERENQSRESTPQKPSSGRLVGRQNSLSQVQKPEVKDKQIETPEKRGGRLVGGGQISRSTDIAAARDSRDTSVPKRVRDSGSTSKQREDERER